MAVKPCDFWAVVSTQGCDDGTRQLKIYEMGQRLKAKHCGWVRVCYPSYKPTEFYAEGWLETPTDPGPFLPEHLPLDRQV